MNKTHWINQSVGYEIYPRSFYDSDGDGLGDIRGIIEKLDYLNNLGVNLLWIGPFYPSPLDDNGYDVSDFTDVDTRLGSLEDIKELIDKCHQRDIRIIFDYVMNQTSDEHPWFIESKSSEENDKRDYYIWSNKPNNWGSFFGGSAWNYSEESDSYYLKIFSDKMPDLNWSNENTRKAMFDVAKFWLDLGCDGFRMDAIAHLGKDMTLSDSEKELEKGIAYDWSKFSNRDQLYDYLAELKSSVLEKYDCITIGEVGGGAKLSDAFRYTKSIDMVFNFDACWCLNQDKSVDVVELKRVINYWTKGMIEKGQILPQYWLNHDHPRVMSQYGNEDEPNLSGKMLATILLFLYGVPFIYNGEEIGMTNAKYTDLADFKDVSSQNFIKMNRDEKTDEELLEVLHHSMRDHGHLPMQWSDKEHAGFSTNKPYLKINSDYQTVNVESQLDDPNSLLNYYKQAIKTRLAHEVFMLGDFELIDPNHDKVFAYKRTYNDVTAYIICNMTNQDVEFESFKGEVLLSNYQDEKEMLRPYESKVILSK